MKKTNIFHTRNKGADQLRSVFAYTCIVGIYLTNLGLNDDIELTKF